MQAIKPKERVELPYDEKVVFAAGNYLIKIISGGEIIQMNITLKTATSSIELSDTIKKHFVEKERERMEKMKMFNFPDRRIDKIYVEGC